MAATIPVTGVSASKADPEPFRIAFVKSCGSSYPPERDVFLPSENVYAVIKTTGKGSMTVRIYIVHNDEWHGGGVMTDRSGGFEEVTLTGDGPTVHEPFLIWSATLTPGEYDVVVDENLNGIRDPGEKVCDSEVTPGFFVVPELLFGTVMAVVAPLAAMTGLATKRKLKH